MTHDTRLARAGSRRLWLQTMGLAGLGAGAGIAPTSARAAEAGDAWASSFRPFDGPAFQGELRAGSLTIEGRLPADLRGCLYRNGPARFRLNDSRLSHWFDGDAMVQAIRLEPGRASHHGRLLDTPKRRQEEAAGRFLYGGFGSTVPNPRGLRSPDELNPANINLLPMAGGKRLYALWEAGSALDLDPDTLTSRGFKAWSPETAGAPFSAHPRVDPDGTVWSFGYMPGTGKLLIYQIGADGHLKRQAVRELPQVDMVHDFAITERHLVFLLQPLVFTARADLRNLLDGMRWNSGAPLLACVMSKATLEPRLFELPTGGVFHLGNAWEEGGLIRLGYARAGSIMALMQQLRIDTPVAPQEPGASVWTEVSIDAAGGRASQQMTDLRAIEFPRTDPRRTGLRHSLTVLLQRGPTMDPRVFGFDTVIVRDGERSQRHAYGSGWIAEEHLYVPHPHDAREGAGWVLGPAYHWPSGKTTLSVFQADALAQGPLAQVRLPYGLPLGLHGQFVAG